MDFFHKMTRILQQKKVIIPIVIGFFMFIGVTFPVLSITSNHIVNLFTDRYEQMAHEKVADFEDRIKATSKCALQKASAFAGDPRILEALNIALGDSSTNGDPDKAREMLKRYFLQSASRFNDLSNGSFRLHVHLNNHGVTKTCRLKYLISGINFCKF